MKLSILIVNWNTRDLVIKCINSVLRYPPDFQYEIIVVDNGSKDGSVGMLTNLFGGNRKIKVMQSLRNLGFAQGNNLAYARAVGEYIFLLNPDTEVFEGSLSKLVSYLEHHGNVGVVGPKLVNPDGSLQRSVRSFPNLRASILMFSGLHRLVRPKKYLMDDFDYGEEAGVDQVMGAALMTRRSLIQKIGFLDEKFWLWMEEVDFCKRVKDAGYKVMFYPKARVMHILGQSFFQMAVYERKKTFARSLTHYFKKNGHFWDIVVIKTALPMVLFMAKALDYLQRLFGFRIKPHVH